MVASPTSFSVSGLLVLLLLGAFLTTEAHAQSLAERAGASSARPAARSAHGAASRAEAPIVGDAAPADTGESALAPPMPCATSILDQASDVCLQASTVPALGKLHPISEALFVDTTGRVGIGTTAPTAELDVDGDMDLSGSLSKDGTLLLHTNGGIRNTALGRDALSSVTAGSRNTAVGHDALTTNTTGSFNTATGNRALLSNTTGIHNTADGFRALYANTMGTYNVAVGSRALNSNTVGNRNTALGNEALFSNTNGNFTVAIGDQALFNATRANASIAVGVEALYTWNQDYYPGSGFNTAVGYKALRSLAGSFFSYDSFNTVVGGNALSSLTTGSSNIAIGWSAGSSTTSGNDNIHIGSLGGAGFESATTRIGRGQTRAFIAGIRGKTTGFADAIPVLIDSNGQLGTISSSRRFKEDIRDMGDTTERLLDLRAVLFRYKTRNADGDGPIEFGLIAEEVAEVFPELVVCDEDGRPETVKYHLLGTMLLNELQKQNARVEELQARDAEMAARIAALEQRE